MVEHSEQMGGLVSRGAGMVKDKSRSVNPAPPVSRNPELKKMEEVFREAVAYTKEIDSHVGSELSRSGSTMLEGLDGTVSRGDKVLAGAKKAHEQVHGTLAEKQERWQSYQNELCEIRSRCPHLGITAARQRVAGIYDVSLKTIERHTK